MDRDDSDYRSSAAEEELPGGYDSVYELSESSGESVVLGASGEEDNEAEVSYTRGDQSPLKRAAEDEEPRPFKRRGAILNADYLDLLNRDIDDAAHRVCLEDDITLPGSQLGLTYWSPLEKRQFFEALSRLGKYDLPGIAQRIGTKSPIEVKHYLKVLHEAVLTRQSQDRRSFLEPSEYPAAVELTPQCCHAQEEAADAVSIRQDSRESQREEEKWKEHWNVTPKIAAEIDKKQQADDGTQNLAFGKLFHVGRWLKLSERVFMNSSLPGNNWRNIDDRPPSMWATTLDDFHALTLSITRRLVQTTLFISMSRIRAKSELLPSTRNIVRKKDVEAAIASLGLAHNTNEIWLKSARRLKLDVYESPPGRNNEDEEEPMTYDEVEAKLAGEEPPRAASVDSEADRLKLRHESSDDEGDENADSAKGSDDEDASLLDEEARAVNREANEVLWYSAVGIRDLKNTRRALKLRIETERRQERHADTVDGFASYAAEADMWDLLEKKPPTEMPKLQHAARATAPQRSNLDVESLYPLNRAWADNLEYHAEWETLQKPLGPVEHDNDDDYD